MRYFKNTLYAPAKPTTIFSGKEKQSELHFLGISPTFWKMLTLENFCKNLVRVERMLLTLIRDFLQKKIDKKISPKIF